MNIDAASRSKSFLKLNIFLQALLISSLLLSAPSFSAEEQYSFKMSSDGKNITVPMSFLTKKQQTEFRREALQKIMASVNPNENEYTVTQEVEPVNVLPKITFLQNTTVNQDQPISVAGYVVQPQNMPTYLMVPADVQASSNNGFIYEPQSNNVNQNIQPAQNTIDKSVMVAPELSVISNKSAKKESVEIENNTEYTAAADGIKPILVMPAIVNHQQVIAQPSQASQVQTNQNSNVNEEKLNSNEQTNSSNTSSDKKAE